MADLESAESAWVEYCGAELDGAVSGSVESSVGSTGDNWVGEYADAYIVYSAD